MPLMRIRNTPRYARERFHLRARARTSAQPRRLVSTRRAVLYLFDGDRSTVTDAQNPENLDSYRSSACKYLQTRHLPLGVFFAGRPFWAQPQTLSTRRRPGRGVRPASANRLRTQFNARFPSAAIPGGIQPVTHRACRTDGLASAQGHCNDGRSPPATG